MTLATEHVEAASILSFYRGLLGAQQHLYDAIDRHAGDNLSGAIERDLEWLRPLASALVGHVASAGSEPLGGEARRLLAGDEGKTIDRTLQAFWASPSDRQFFAKAICQPYLQRLRERRVPPAGRAATGHSNRCPWCGGAPQLSILHGASDLEGGGRLLQCAACLTTWPFRRVVCAFCGEEDDRKLGYFHAPRFDHLRVDGCDSCRRYLKTVDLTRLGLAVPLVDEVAGASLDLWARDHGYEKIELNLVGL